jgi:hypothetical protein
VCWAVSFKEQDIQSLWQQQQDAEMHIQDDSWALFMSLFSVADSD